MSKLIKAQDPIWLYPHADSEWCKRIVSEFNIHPVLAQIFVTRGFKDLESIHEFLYAKLPKLHDPHLIADMDKAVGRVLKALELQETILVYGDNDVDGITGTSLLTEFLRKIGINTLYYAPNRNSLKNSLILDALDYAKRNKCTLLITVDCGITAANEIKEVVSQGVDVIVTDHHEPTAKIPHCIATLNPKLFNSAYPNRDITGVGVAFKLVHALTNVLISLGKISPTKIDLKRFLDLVALGTIADMGALVGENRVLVRYGLRQIRKTRRVGLIKLLEVCELKQSEVTTTDIASKVAPRVNSLGRIANPMKGIELLLARDPHVAEKLASELDLNNIERQKIERKDTEDVVKLIEKHPQILTHRAIVLHSNKWHPGIIPIITARISKQYNRPTVIIAIDDGVGKGSMRTIPEFPLLQSLHDNSDLLINFGGHDYAAGLTIQERNIESFTSRFIAAVEGKLQDTDIMPKLQLDAEVSFEDLTYDFMEGLSLLEPFGTGNPAPVFYCQAQQVWPPKVVGKTHLKLYLEQNERALEGIGFGLAEKRSKISRKDLPVLIAFTPQINTFLNKSSIQLQIRDVRVDESAIRSEKGSH